MAKQIIIIIIILLLGGGGYFLMQSYFSTDATKDISNDDQAAKASAILAQLSKVQSIKLDSTIFDNPVYKRLENFSRQIDLKPVGKNNPFSPDAGQNITDNTSTTTESISITTSNASTTPKASSTKPAIKKKP